MPESRLAEVVTMRSVLGEHVSAVKAFCLGADVSDAVCVCASSSSRVEARLSAVVA